MILYLITRRNPIEHIPGRRNRRNIIASNHKTAVSHEILVFWKLMMVFILYLPIPLNLQMIFSTIIKLVWFILSHSMTKSLISQLSRLQIFSTTGHWDSAQTIRILSKSSEMDWILLVMSFFHILIQMSQIPSLMTYKQWTF